MCNLFYFADNVIYSLKFFVSFYSYHAIAGRGVKYSDAESEDEMLNDNNPEAFHCHELLYNIQELIDDTEKNIISVRF